MNGFHPGEIIKARRLRAEGNAWYAVAIAIGRKSPYGIRRRLDADFHKRSNAYQARWMRARRSA